MTTTGKKDGTASRAQDGASTICLLGMHRSGTSCLTGCLQEAGLFLGEVVTEAPFNRKGNRESLRIRELHEDLLRTNGGTWDQPPERIVWHAGHRAERDQIISSFPAGARWGFKDPRTLLVLDGWLEALPAMRCVGSFRHPLAVAASLAARDGFGLEQSLELWTRYNRLLLQCHHELGCALVSFDLQEKQYLEQVHRLAVTLGLSPPAAGFDFFEEWLRTQHDPGRGELPAAVAELYQQLHRAAGPC